MNFKNKNITKKLKKKNHKTKQNKTKKLKKKKPKKKKKKKKFIKPVTFILKKNLFILMIISPKPSFNIIILIKINFKETNMINLNIRNIKFSSFFS